MQARPWWEQLLAPVLDLLGYLLARFIQTLVDTTAGARAGTGWASRRSVWRSSLSSWCIWFARCDCR